MSLRPADALAVLARADEESRWGRRGRPLSPRTRAVLALVAAGLTSAEIAGLRASSITLVQGRAVLTLQRRAAIWSATLPPLLAAPVLAWIKKNLLRGQAHLFSDAGGPLTASALRKVLARHLPAHRRRKRTVRRPGRRTGPPAAVVNPAELVAHWEGQGGRRPLSLRALAARLGVSPPTVRRHLQALRAAGKLDDAARARALATWGRVYYVGGPRPNPIEEPALKAAWGKTHSIAGIARRLRASRRRIKARLQQLGLL